MPDFLAESHVLMSEPWYKAGLRFRCTRCGSCCTGPPGYVWINDAEVEAIANFRGEAAGEIREYYTREVGQRRSLTERSNGDCVFYDRSQGCTIYPARPRQCRTWPFWESNIVTPEAWKKTCEICPGSGTGELISEDEITRRMNVIRL